MPLLEEVHQLLGHQAPVRVVKFNSTCYCNANLRNFGQNRVVLQKVQKTDSVALALCLYVRNEGNGNYCMSGGYDKHVVLWNPHQAKQIKAFKGHGYQVMDISIAFDNSAFVSCGGDKQPFLWDVGTGVIVRKVKGHEQMINSVAFNSDASIFVSGSYDQTAKVWDCKSRSFEAIQVLEGATDSVTGVQVGESEIYTSSVDGCLRSYDLRMGQLRIDHIGVPLTYVSLSKCGRMILLSCLDGTIRVLDRGDGSLLRAYSGHVNREFKLDAAFFREDAFVVSGSEDGRLFCWNCNTDETITVAAHDRMVSGVSPHPDGEYIVTCSADTTVKLWKWREADTGV